MKTRKKLGTKDRGKRREGTQAGPDERTRLSSFRLGAVYEQIWAESLHTRWSVLRRHS